MAWVPAATAAISAIGSIMAAKASNKGSNTTTTTIDPQLQPYLADLYSRARSDILEGPAVAPFDPLQQLGQSLQLNTAVTDIPHWINQQNNSLGFLANPNILNPATNPYLSMAAEGAVNPIMQRLMSQVLPGISSGAAAAGNIGSSRQGVVESLAINDAIRNAMDTTASMYNQNYGQGLNAMINAQQYIPQAAALSLLPADIINQVGGARQAQNQRELDENYTQLQRYQSLLRGTGSSSTVMPNAYINPAQAGIGGALAGYGLGNALYGNNTPNTPYFPSTAGSYDAYAQFDAGD